MPITFANQAAFVAQLALFVPDMKGGYTEADFIQEAVAILSEDKPAWEEVDVGDGTTKVWTLGASPFGGWATGFSDLWPVEYEALDSDGNPYEPPILYTPRPRIVQRTSGGNPALVLSFSSAPSATAKCRVKFRKPWTIASGSTNVPNHLQLAVVKKAAAKKCAALSTFYKQSIDPAGGSDIFDARMYAEQYASDAKRWGAEYAELVGLGGEETRVAFGAVRRGQATAFGPRGG